MAQLSREAFIDRAAEIYEAGYIPNDDVQAGLTETALVSITAPAGTGKDARYVNNLLRLEKA